MSEEFSQLGLPTTVVLALGKQGITQPFPIQSAVIPHAMAGRDIQGQAPTGSGKTLAFGLPLLSMVSRAERNRPRALVLTPTRELAEQIRRDLASLSDPVGRRVAAVYGGVPYGPQKVALRTGVDVLVATPGRLEDLIDQGVVLLEDVTMVVVDEADRMGDMGFLPAVRRILDRTSQTRQTMLFSATLEGEVAVLGRRYQHNPVCLEAGGAGDRPSEATHHFWHVEAGNRVSRTAEIIKQGGRTIVFTRTRRGADRLARQLDTADVTAVALHGGRSQSQRARALRAFTAGRANALVATDVAARGLHVDNVSTVVHFDMPGDDTDYLHRSGRTGRAGAAGAVVSLVLGDQITETRRRLRRLGLDATIGRPETTSQVRESAPSPRLQAKGSSSDARIDLYVGNLPWASEAEDLERLFRRHGRVENASVIGDRRTGRSKGYGFVGLTPEDPAAVMDALRGVKLGGRVLDIRFARPPEGRASPRRRRRHSGVALGADQTG